MTSLLSWFRARPVVTDVILAILIASAEAIQAIAINSSNVNDDIVAPTLLIHWVLIILSPLVVVFRRTHPIPSLAVGVITTMAMWALDLPVTGLAGMFVLYSSIVYGPKELGARAAYLSAGILLAFSVLGVSSGQAPFYILPLVAWTVSIPILVALNLTSNRALLAASDRKLADAQERRLADKQAIIQDERRRVSRELHDVVAHGLSVIVVQAGAANRILSKSTESDRAEAHDKVSKIVEDIDGAARQSLDEMRQILGVLRGIDDSAQWRPSPGSMAITELVAQASQSGLDVTFETVGTPRPLPTAVGAATYRIVQEALTNVRKHGGPAVKASVVGTFDQDSLSILIEDDGRGAAAADSDGHGLIGMRERTELLGGSFKSGPKVGGGFRVFVRLPLVGATPSPSTSGQEVCQ